ncbi:UNVERIFIED_CONTAM: hypothetical protein FKN15_044880 [Acipenser sinensis]
MGMFEPLDPCNRTEWLQTVFPQALRETVLRAVHGGPATGHFSVAKTLGQLQEQFYWEQCRHNMEIYLRSTLLWLARARNRNTTPAARAMDYRLRNKSGFTAGLCLKLASHWEGPCAVIERLSEMTYRVRLRTRGRAAVLHQDRLAPYCSGTNLVDHTAGPEACPGSMGKIPSLTTITGGASWGSSRLSGAKLSKQFSTNFLNDLHP